MSWCEAGDTLKVEKAIKKYGIEAILNITEIDTKMNCLSRVSCYNDHSLSLVWLLLRYNADPDEGGSNQTVGMPLSCSVRGGKKKDIELLLAYGADPNKCRWEDLGEGQSSATYNDQRVICKMLFQAGQNPNRNETFMFLVRWAWLGAIREMAKWMETVPTITEGDVAFYHQLFDQIKEEIKSGRDERETSLGVCQFSYSLHYRCAVAICLCSAVPQVRFQSRVFSLGTSVVRFTISRRFCSKLSLRLQNLSTRAFIENF